MSIQTKTVRGKPGRKPKARAEDEEPDEEYEVEEILDDNVNTKTKQPSYFIKWKGYSEEENTWEPKKNLAHATALLKEYEASKKEKKAAPKKAAPKKSAPKKAAPKKTAAKKAPAAKKTAAPAKKAAAAPKKKASPVKPAGRAGRRPGRPKKH